MESQLQHTHGRHYDDHDPLTAGHHTGHDYNEDEHHGEKKSVIKKVKEKAKKLKNTITKHGHGHDHHHHHDEDDDDYDDDDETVEDPEVHGAPMYDSARVGLGGPDAMLAQPRGNLERPSVMAEDRYTTRPDVVHCAPPPVSTGPYGTNLSEPPGRGHTQGYDDQEVNPEKWRGKIGQSTAMEEDPFAPNPTRMVSPTNVTDPTYGATRVLNQVGKRGQGQDVNVGGLRGSIGKSTGMVEDPHAPKDPSGMRSDPSNYESKVTNPTHTGGGKAAELSQIQHSFDKMGIRDEHEHESGSGGEFFSEPKTFDPKHPENLPRETLTGNPSSRTTSYAEKISSSATALADKAADIIASKLGYSSQTPSTEPHETEKSSDSATDNAHKITAQRSSTESQETVKNSGSVTDYAHKITDKVTGTLAPVYEKVVEAGSSVMSKVQGSVSGTRMGEQEMQRGSETTTMEKGTAQPQMHKGSEVEKEKGGDKGLSVKEYLVETLRPGDEDKALSEVITQAFLRGNHGESEKKSGEDRPMGRVTESVEVRERLGSDCRDEQQDNSSNVSVDKGVSERLRDAVGPWFGGKGDAPQGTLGTSYVTDEGLSSNPRGDRDTTGRG